MRVNKRILLYPVSLIWGLITSLRNFLFDYGILSSVEFDFPVICVGNITVGGTGKTPHTEYLAELLRKDFCVATLSRGYKRKTRDFRIASTTSTVSEIGDEPMQIYNKFPEVLVAVSRRRVAGVRKILEINPGAEVIILDDAYQHRRITPGFTLLLIDYNRLIYNDYMLPYGNLREYMINMRRADVILITKSPADLSPIQRRVIVKEMNKEPYQNLYFTSTVYKDPEPVFKDTGREQSMRDISQFAGSGIVLVTGIANPRPLKDYLEKTAASITHLSFPDHHKFREKDIARICSVFDELSTPSKYLFTTEKDAVRLREFSNIAEAIKSSFYFVPVGVHFLNDDKDEFDNLILRYVRENIRNNRISEDERDGQS